ncbi:MAG: adenylate/guanylate cyclase domain-containing protein [Gammaproteobacteria bacterium]|nr:adenylate/guanylate cyclase domain-containing protein [Gammaproteobacteria bacterium]
MSRRTHQKFRLYAILVAISVLAGFINSYLTADPSTPVKFSELAFDSFSWFFGASLYLCFDLFWIPSRYGAVVRRMYFLKVIAVKALVLTSIVVLAGFVSQALFQDTLDFNFLLSSDFHQVVLIVILVATVLLAITQVVRIIGARTLVNFILGRYHQPIHEDTIFMFLDLADSTALTERLGDLGVQTMITQFFFDISEPIVEYEGEIHRYVGDQVVITWPLRKPEDNIRAIECYFAIVQRVEEKSEKYLRQFNTIPRFRVGMHGGPVVISECGDQKQEISYFGDTINTTARIEGHCKTLDCPLLVSSELLQHMQLPPTYIAQSRHSVQLRGREAKTELFTIVLSES